MKINNNTNTGKNLITNGSFSATLNFYNAGAIFGEWDGSFEVNGTQWWNCNDGNINSRFASNSTHYSMILVR